MKEEQLSTRRPENLMLVLDQRGPGKDSDFESVWGGEGLKCFALS